MPYGLCVEVRGQACRTHQVSSKCLCLLSHLTRAGDFENLSCSFRALVPFAIPSLPCSFFPCLRSLHSLMHVAPRKKKTHSETSLEFMYNLPTAVRSRRQRLRLHCFGSLNPHPWTVILTGKVLKGPQYLSPGMSSRLVIPVQLMSSVWKKRAEESA